MCECVGGCLCVSLGWYEFVGVGCIGVFMYVSLSLCMDLCLCDVSLSVYLCVCWCDSGVVYLSLSVCM